MEDKIIGYLNLILGKILESEKELLEKENHNKISGCVSPKELFHSKRKNSAINHLRHPQRIFKENFGYEKKSMRVYSSEEKTFLDTDALAYLQNLLRLDIVDIEFHEDVIEKAREYHEGVAGIEEIKIIISMMFAENDYPAWYKEMYYAFTENVSEESCH